METSLSDDPIHSSGQYVAVITLDGQRFVFDATAGEDLGTYQGEYVKQKCIRVTRKDTPLTVYFRPDVGLPRLEVVVELGRMWLDGTGFHPAHIVTPYTCEIQHSGQTVATVQVPHHWWFARWRWQSAPRPVVRSPATLVAKRLVPPYGRTGLYGGVSTSRTITWSGPMDTAGLDTSMPDTGDRPDIGLFTEFQGDYLIHRSPAALTSLLAQGEAGGTMPIHWRDERAGAFVDVYAYPGFGEAGGQGKPQLPAPPPPRLPNGQIDKRYFNCDTAHFPANSYLPFVLTDDPYFLEELAAQGSYAILWTNWFRNLYKLPGLVFASQTRGFAWGMRALFQLGVVAPDNPPRWLNARKYWRQCIADNLAYVQLYMKSPARVHRIFHAFAESNRTSAFMDSYMTTVLAMSQWMGYEDWRDFTRWFYYLPTQLCNGRSGWNREWPMPFWVTLIRTAHLDTMHLVPDASLDNQTLASWAEAWQLFKQQNKVDDSGWDGHTIMQKVAGPIYFIYLRGSLAFATHIGIPEARECYDYIDREIPLWIARHYPGFDTGDCCRWSIDPA